MGGKLNLNRQRVSDSAARSISLAATASIPAVTRCPVPGTRYPVPGTRYPVPPRAHSAQSTFRRVLRFLHRYPPVDRRLNPYVAGTQIYATPDIIGLPHT
jgi:hypothetical protein